MPDIDQFTKQEEIEKLYKRQKTDEGDKKKFFIEGERAVQSDTRATSSNLWDDHEKSYLDNVTMTMYDDDEVMKNTKGKTVMKWDKFKKRYTLQKVDREGKVMAERRNEAGKVIKKNDKHEDIYKKWQQKTHLTLQKVGEKEDSKMIQQAKSNYESRGMMKQFGARHKDLNKGEDVHDPKAMLERKGKKMLDKSKMAGGKEKGGEKRQYSSKAQQKILARAAPTRSKAIVKNKNYNAYNDKKRQPKGRQMNGSGGGRQF